MLMMILDADTASDVGRCGWSGWCKERHTGNNTTATHAATALHDRSSPLWWDNITLCLEKNIPNIFDCILKTNYQILIIFDKEDYECLWRQEVTGTAWIGLELNFIDTAQWMEKASPCLCSHSRPTLQAVLLQKDEKWTAGWSVSQSVRNVNKMCFYALC